MTSNYTNSPMGVLTHGYELGVGVYLKAGNHDPLQQLLIGVAENPLWLICEPLSFEPNADNVHIHSFTLC